MLRRKMLLNVFPIYLVIFQLQIQFKVGKCEKEVLNRSGFGEFFIDWKYVGPCESSTGTNEIQMNVKLTKKNKRPQIFGNYTLLIPWDETINMELQYAKLGSNSAWIPNAFFMTLSGCTQYRLILAGSGFLKHMNLPNRCPMPKGVYVMREYDVEKIVADAGSLVPKTFFYGSYKVICDLKKNDRLVGCARIAIDVIPKWQRRNRTRYE